MIDSARIRRELERLLADQTAAVRDLAQRVADETWKRVEAGESAAKAVAGAMNAAGVDEALQQRLGRDVVQSLCAGAGILPEIKTAGLIDQFAALALTLSWDSSGMPLSSRLHSAQVQQDVAHVISSAISRRDNAWRTARKIYDGYGFGGALKAQSLSALPKDMQALVARASPALTGEDKAQFLAAVANVRKYAQSLRTAPLRAAYTQLLDRLDKGLTRGLENAVRVAAEEKTRYFAERILRTESARAWGEGFSDQLDRDEDATGLRWETSSAHRIFDVCDFHHRADLFGMGPGVYPKEHRPSYPAHPHCLCVLSAWYRGKAHPQVEEGGKRALEAMSEGERVRLLGVQGAQVFEGGGSWRGRMRNWTDPQGAAQSQGARETLAAAIASLDPHAKRIEAAAISHGWKIWKPGDPIPPPFEGRTEEQTADGRRIQADGLRVGVPLHHYALLRRGKRQATQNVDLPPERMIDIARTGQPFANQHGQLLRYADGAYVVFDKETGWVINVMVRNNNKESSTWTPLP